MQVFLFYPMQFIWKHLSSTYSIQKKVYKSLNFFQHTSKILKRVKKQALLKNKRMETNNEQMVEAKAPENETQYRDPDNKLETGMKNKNLPGQFDVFDDRTNIIDEFRRLQVSYQQDEFDLKFFYNYASDRGKYYIKTATSVRKNEQKILAAEKTYTDTVTAYNAKRIERQANFKVYDTILEKLIPQNELEIVISKQDKKDGRLQLIKEYQKEMKKYQAEIKDQIAIFNVRNLVEANTKIVFTDKRSKFVYKDENIMIEIGHNVHIKDATGWNLVDITTEFDLEKFLNILPTKYWLGLHRQRQIESIFD